MPVLRADKHVLDPMPVAFGIRFGRGLSGRAGKRLFENSGTACSLVAMSGDPQTRMAFLKEYLAGVQSMDPARAMRAAAPGYLWYDGMVAEPITKDRFSDYLLGWEDRMKAIGGTGRYEVSDELFADQGGHILRWTWWQFAGTDVSGSALLKVGDEGVIYEKIAYFKPT